MVESTASKCGSKIRRIVDKSGGTSKTTTTKNAEETRVEKQRCGGSGSGEPRERERGAGDNANAILLSRRRRHKTVHFTESPVNEFATRNDDRRSASCCRDDGRGSVVSLPDEFDNHVQQLFTFIGTVLSAWDTSSDHDDEGTCKTTTTSTTSVSISVNRTATTTTTRGATSASQSTARIKKRQRDVLHFLLYSSQSKLNIDENVGCQIYRHRHWKIASGTCNALFLKKVRIFILVYVFVYI